MRRLLLLLTCLLLAGCSGKQTITVQQPAAGGGTPAATATEAASAEATEEATAEATEAADAEGGGSSGGEASPDSTDRPDTDGDGSPDVATFRGKVGDSFTLVGQPGYKKAAKDAVRVTVLGITGPFSGFDVGAGHKLIGIKVRFEGAGSERYEDPQPGGELTLVGGETGDQTSLITGTGKNPCDNPSLKLKKGDKVEACLAYDIPKNAKPQVFQYSADSGFGDKGVWRLK